MTTIISEIIKNGIIFDVKNWSKKIMNTDNLLIAVDNLFKIFESQKIDYLLVGGIALLSYVEGRNTQDIDFILSRQSLASIQEINVIDENQDFIRGLFLDLQVDILLTNNKLFDYVLKNFSTIRIFGERETKCVSVEGLILLKLYALPSLYRQGKFDRASIYENDILLLILNYTVNLNPLIKLLKNHLIYSDLEQIKDIINEINNKIKRFSQYKQH